MSPATACLISTVSLPWTLNRWPTLTGRFWSPSTYVVSGWTVPWRMRIQAILPTNGSVVILKAWPTNGLDGSAATGTSAASAAVLSRTGRPLAWAGEGKYLDHGVHEFLHADFRAGGGEQHRDDRPGDHGRGERRRQLFRGNRLRRPGRPPSAPRRPPRCSPATACGRRPRRPGRYRRWCWRSSRPLPCRRRWAGSSACTPARRTRQSPSSGCPGGRSHRRSC